jgi:hypothetical protein
MRNAVKATKAAVTLTAKPGSGAIPPRPTFRSTATTPKHAADSKGSTSLRGRTAKPRPDEDSSVVPRTMTSVPMRMVAVTRSPRNTIASIVDTRGLRLPTAAATDAPTVSMLMKRSRRPATVPMRPASAKYTMPAADGVPTPPVAKTPSHKHAVPTATLIHIAVYGP